MTHHMLFAAAMLGGCTSEASEPVAAVVDSVANAKAQMHESADVRSPICPVDHPFFNLGPPANSPYYVISAACAEGVRFEFDFYAFDDASGRLSSDLCPDVQVEFAMPKGDPAQAEMDNFLLTSKTFLQDRIVEFRSQCGLANQQSIHLLDGFEDVYAQHLHRSWINNRYISYFKGEPPIYRNEQLWERSENAYAQTH